MDEQRTTNDAQRTTKWTDAHGRTWSARITLATWRRLKSEEGIDLTDTEQISRIVSDPFAVVELLVAVHSDQAGEEGISEGDFAELCTENDTVAVDAAEALVEGLADFFGRVRRPALAAVVRKAYDAASATEQTATAMVDERGQAVMTAEMDRAKTMLAEAFDAAERGELPTPRSSSGPRS